MSGETLETEFQDTPSEWSRRWTMEFAAARKDITKFHERGDKVIKRYLDERENSKNGDTRLNLFTADIQTKQAILYGKIPNVSVSRRFADADDDTARVAGVIMERLLNTDIERDSDNYATALAYVRDDRLLPGLGVARVRYVAEFEPVPEQPAMIHNGVEVAPVVPATERKVNESVETDYVHWKDFLWSPSRVWHEATWVAFRADISRKELEARFGDEGKLVPLNSKRNGSVTEEDAKKASPWGRADLWEIWDKGTQSVFFFVEGYNKVLTPVGMPTNENGSLQDPLGLETFFPCPKPMLANTTTSSTVPRADLTLYQDQYNEIDMVSTRITLLERAIRVVGAYDASNSELKKLLSEHLNNEMIPVQNFASFQEKGGLAGAIVWLPLDQVVNALTTLRDYRRELIDSLYQVTGQSDIMRGQGTQPNVTASEQKIKAKFGSVRIQALQDEFARFASDLQKLKAEIISKHFDEQTILQRCNCEFGPDKDLAPQAVKLIKDKFADYRIEVKPEAVSLTDFAALKEERLEVIGALGSYFSMMGPVGQQMPQAIPYLLEILKWAVAGLRGGSAIEGVLDRAVTQAQQAAANPQQKPQAPDPKLLVQQAKTQGELQKVQAESQARQMEIQAEVQADAQRERTQGNENIREAMVKHQIGRAERVEKQFGPMGPLGRGPIR
jgi:hypothetical protein